MSLRRTNEEVPPLIGRRTHFSPKHTGLWSKAQEIVARMIFIQTADSLMSRNKEINSKSFNEKGQELGML